MDKQLQSSGQKRRSAFSVIELMLAIAIMGVIIFALYNVFDQTQRAMRSTQVQTDVSEKARAIMEMVGRELEQAQPSHVGINGLMEVNLFGGLEHQPQVIGAGNRPEDRKDIPPRTNLLHNIFFLNNRTNAWQGIGYRVIYVTNSVGVLQRFETNLYGHRPYSNRLSSAFVNEPLTSTNYHHVADGIIHFSVIPYDRNGYRLGWDTTNRVPGYYSILRRSAEGEAFETASDTTETNLANVILQEAFQDTRAEVLEYSSNFAFRSNAMPAYIDLQLGILEPEALAQYYLMLEDENPNAGQFLARQISKVHLFRQRIPIRTAAQ